VVWAVMVAEVLTSGDSRPRIDMVGVADTWGVVGEQRIHAGQARAQPGSDL